MGTDTAKWAAIAASIGLLSCSGGGGNGGRADLPLAEVGLNARAPNPTCVAPARPAFGATIALQDAFPALRFNEPLGLLQAPGDASRWYVLEKSGRVLAFANDPAVSTTTVFADLRARVNATFSESGLLGLAFHPNYASNRQVFISYTANGSPLTSIVSRFSADAAGNALGAEQVLLTLAQPFENHNGGHIAFGPDGYLYIGFGDGGSSGDPQGNAQNVNVLLGKMLRIDVNNGNPYAIPADNPFAAGGGRAEIYAWGLRNPWRWSFDRDSGDLWAGDVGQNAYEEIDRIQRGGNYGWPIREGFQCYNAATCSRAGLLDPVIAYGRSEGFSVTGGYVYRGQAMPALRGTYIYADFGGTIWGLTNDAQGNATASVLLQSNRGIATFGEGVDGELYITDLTGGKIYRLVGAAAAPSNFPERLSETGCMQADNPTQARAGLIPYDVNVPFWSDGAEKQRWLALPDNTAIGVDAEGDWDLPVGTVLVKNFMLENRVIETRLFMRHTEGEWAGYSYEWNDAQTEAFLVRGGKTKPVGAQTWVFPSSAECTQCHTTAAGHTLGLETRQLNRLFNYYDSGLRANQLTTFEHLGLFATPLGAAAQQPVLTPTRDETQPLAARARAYLHANCAYCHRPGATAQGPADLRITTSDAAMNICDIPPTQGDLGIADARLLAPGMPARSLLSVRMHRRDAYGMPPVASRLIDSEGAALIDAWIQAKSGCP